MKVIKTFRGEEVIVDDEDFASMSAFKWSLDGKGYAIRNARTPDGKKTTRLMHRELMGLETGDSRHVDHKDGNPLNNTRQNLRLCNRFENQRNARRRVDNGLGLKGVGFKKQQGKYVARIRVNGKPKHLGYFADPHMAHEFYCLAADMLYGQFANHG